MLGVFVFGLLGAAIGWFSYRETSWFLEISAVVGFAAFTIFRWTVLPLVAVAEDHNREQTSVTLRVFGLLPEWSWDALLAASATLLLTRIAIHVKDRCYTEPPAPETREQRRARLQTEMKYEDGLL